VRIETIDPRTTPEWDDFVAAHAEATVFHTSAWCRVLTDTYRYKPMYVASREESGAITGGVPLMVVDSLLTSRRLVGLPFSDVCGPLLPENGGGRLLDTALAEVARTRSTSVEVRGRSGEMRGYSNGTDFYQHIIDLDGDLESKVHNSARRAIRKAEKEGVTVRVSSTLEDTRRFYDLMVHTRRKHGLLPQPWRFFKNIHKHLIAPGHGYLLLADYQGQTIAGDLLLRFRDQLTYKFNASDPQFLEVRPNNLLLWQAMHLGAEAGQRTLDLGRCELDNEGLRRFKLLWGAREQRVGYYHYPETIAGSALLSAKPTRAALSFFVKHAPDFALEGAGAALYGNFG
jgi:CelD/BcsL family acetyltransferase involved in cellulose biosynthesis